MLHIGSHNNHVGSRVCNFELSHKCVGITGDEDLVQVVNNELVQACEVKKSQYIYNGINILSTVGTQRERCLNPSFSNPIAAEPAQ